MKMVTVSMSERSYRLLMQLLDEHIESLTDELKWTGDPMDRRALEDEITEVDTMRTTLSRTKVEEIL